MRSVIGHRSTTQEEEPQEGARVDTSTTGRHIPALDGVRGIAVLLVMLVHLFTRNPAPNAIFPIRFLSEVFASGWIGVDLFFSLSGFLITGILYDTMADPHFFRNFYARRALRIFPLYYGFIFLMMAISMAQGYHWFAKPLLLILTHFTTLIWTGYGYTTASWVNLNHLWSLNIEEQFYLVWPLTIFLLKSRRRIAMAAACGAVGSMLLRCVLHASGATVTYPYVVYTWTPAHLDGLLLGALLAMLVRSRLRGNVLRWSPVVLAVGGAVVLAAILGFGGLHSTANPWVSTIGYQILAITFCGLIGSVLRTGSLAGRICGSGVLRLFGKYSYGMYVFHFTLRELLAEPLHERILLATGSKAAALLGSAVTLLLVTLGLAAASFHLFEQPILRLKRYFAAHGGRPRLRRETEMANRQAEAVQ